MVAAMKHVASNFSKLEKFKWDGGDNPTVEQNVESSKELWDTLEAKYMAEDASCKKFLASNFINYKMTNSRPVLEKYNELFGILGRFTQHRINMDESIQDNDKPKGNNVFGPLVVNMVEHNNSSRYNDNKGKRKHHDTRVDPNKKPKVICWKCGKPRDLKRDYKAGNDGNKSNRSGTKGLVDGMMMLYDGLTLKKLLNFVSDNIGSTFMLTSELNNSILWHARLGHVHFKRMQDMSKDGLILAFDMDIEKAVVRLLDPKLKTLGERGIECIFVGYAEHSKAFRFFVIEPNDSVSINSIIESRDAIFDEQRFSLVPRPSQRSLVRGNDDSGGSVVPEKVTDEIVP
ncbi:zinc finger, CCHC-type containing protein [Tanacetum coccineum]